MPGRMDGGGAVRLGMRDDEQVIAQTLPGIHDQSSLRADRPDAEVARREAVPAEQRRRDVHEHLVDEPRPQERRREGRPPFDEDALDAELAEASEQVGQVFALVLHEGEGVSAHTSLLRDRAGADDDRSRLRLVEGAVGAARGECRVVGEERPGADDDRIGRRAALVHVGAGGGSRDPLTRPVGCRCAPVERLGPLHRHVRARESLHREPGVQEFPGFGFSDVRRHLDARGTQALGAPARELAGVIDGVDDARDAGVDQRLRARARAAGVIARLEGDDRRGPARGIR